MLGFLCPISLVPVLWYYFQRTSHKKTLPENHYPATGMILHNLFPSLPDIFFGYQDGGAGGGVLFPCPWWIFLTNHTKISLLIGGFCEGSTVLVALLKY